MPCAWIQVSRPTLSFEEADLHAVARETQRKRLTPEWSICSFRPETSAEHLYPNLVGYVVRKRIQKRDPKVGRYLE